MVTFIVIRRRVTERMPIKYFLGASVIIEILQNTFLVYSIGRIIIFNILYIDYTLSFVSPPTLQSWHTASLKCLFKEKSVILQTVLPAPARQTSMFVTAGCVLSRRTSTAFSVGETHTGLTCLQCHASHVSFRRLEHILCSATHFPKQENCQEGWKSGLSGGRYTRLSPVDRSSRPIWNKASLFKQVLCLTLSKGHSSVA